MDIGKLRPVAAAEVELMRTWRNAPEVRKNMYTRHEISPQEHGAWWERMAARSDVRYLMYESVSGQPQGIVGFNSISTEDRHACWAFYAAPGAAPGTGSRMELLALDCAFGELGLHKLWCEVLAFNEPVIRLHRKFGFQPEGLFRQHHVLDGAFVDIHRLGLLASEWAEVRPEVAARIEGRRGR